MAERLGSARSLAGKWGGYPLYGAVLLQGIPLDRRLGAWRSKLDQNAQQQLVDRVTTVGATQSLLPAVVWGALYLVAFFLLARKGGDQQLRRLSVWQWPLLALLVFGLFSVAWSPNVGKVIASSFHAIGVTAVAMAAAIRSADHTPSFMKALTLCFALNLVIHLSCVFVAPDMGVASDGRWMGMATHSNSLGSQAFVAVWACFMAVALHKGGPRILPLGALAISLVVLVGSGSATSLVSAAAMLGFGCFLLISGKWPRKLKQFANVAISIGAVGLAVAITVSGSVMAMLTARLGKSEDFTGRSELWQQAWQLIKQHPVLGWGFDDNARVIVETGFRYQGFHNGYLDLGVRGGAIALLLMFLALWCWLTAVVRADAAWRLVCLPMLAAFLMYNLMEVSLFSPRNIIWMVVSTLMFCTVLRIRVARTGLLANVR